MIDLLRDNPLLILFLVAALGFALGQVRIAGFSLGTAAVLFAGLAVGAIDPQLRLPEIVYQTGLVLFVYSMGLSGGPVFFRSLRQRGLHQNGLVVVVLVAAALLVRVLGRAAGLSGPTMAGLFAGSLTNTPALAGVIEALRHAGATADAGQSEPVVAYSLAYPIGVLGMILAMGLAQRWWGGAAALADRTVSAPRPLVNETVEVTAVDLCGVPLGSLLTQEGWRVLFGRLRRDGYVMVCDDGTCLKPGDRVSVIGLEADVAAVSGRLGPVCREHLEMDRSRLDYRRMAVSNRQAVGRPLRELALPRRFGALITRIRRGDVDVLAHGDSVLELGDRVRVVAPPDQMGPLGTFFGDSYKALSEVDGITLGLGIAMGLLIGTVPIGLPGGATLKLGFAGGPLLAGLMLGALGKTGRLVWSLPYSANLTLRQFGLILFLAGIGTRSGYAFASTVSHGGGLLVVALGAVVTMATALVALWVALRWLRMSPGMAMGMVAGLQTQPALLAYANDQEVDDQANIGYATVFPVAMVVKIVLAQLLL